MSSLSSSSNYLAPFRYSKDPQLFLDFHLLFSETTLLWGTSSVLHILARSISFFQFSDFASEVRTLSFGEGVTCFGFGTRYDCIEIVQDNSSNPGYDPAKGHRFVKTSFNHRDTCKPEDRRDFRYLFARDFLRDVLKI